MPDLLCMGEPMLELNQRRRQPNSPGGEVLYLQGHGGDTSNAAIAAARNGAGVGYVTAVGRDAPGDSFLALWAREGVDSSTVARSESAPTGLYVVSHGEDGHRFTYYRAGSAASRMEPADVPEDAIRGARMLHVSGVSQAISSSACDAVFRAIEVAKAAGVGVSYDTNLRLSLWPKARATAVIHEPVNGYTEEQYEAFWGAGYTWDDALALDELWQGDVIEAKSAAGQMIIDGEQVPVAPGSTDGPTGT